MRRLLALVLATTAMACGGTPPTSLAVGGPAPAFELSAVDGSTVSLAELAGEPRALVFWATWCGPCLSEIPALQAIEKDDPGRVISIALDGGGAADVREFLESRPLPYRVLLGDADLFARYDGLAIPQTVVLDRELRVVSVHRGAVGETTLRRELDAL